jgi:hypothetical protein
LTANLLGDRGVEILASAFQKNLSLVSLSIGSNDISGVGLEILFNSLTYNNSLYSLDLSTKDGLHRNRLTTHKAQIALKNFLLNNKFCKVLKMRGVFLGVHGLKVILESFMSFKNEEIERLKKLSDEKERDLKF